MVLALLLWLRKCRTFHGQIILAYVLCYWVARFVVEWWRDDQHGWLWGLSVAQWISAILFPLALIFYFRLRGVGNWLSLRQAQALLNAPDASTKKGRRDRAMLAVLLGCGLRRSEVAALTLQHIQQRDNRWCIVDLIGKHGRVRTIPMPTWAKVAIDAWTSAAGLAEGFVFRPVNRGDEVSGQRMSEKVVWQFLRRYAEAAGVPGIAPHDARRTCAKLCRAAGGELEQIQLLLGHASVQTTERYLGTKQDLVHAPNDGIKLRV
jgi:integrase